ncbi:MAG TPA: hypothetical protein VGI20_05420 [Rhizomicrobium sp.]|jgi:hypothetical protein
MPHHSTMSRIHLELARTPEFPEGSARHGYDLVAPLTPEGHVDTEAWSSNREACTITRFWDDSPEEHGHLLHVRGGWCFDYGDGDEDDDEMLFKLDRHVFSPGAYVTITERDRKQYPFRVMTVTPMVSRD